MTNQELRDPIHSDTIPYWHTMVASEVWDAFNELKNQMTRLVGGSKK